MKLIFYTNKFVPSRFAAVTYGPIILIRPAYKNDIGLLEHEKIHVKQFWRTFGLTGLFYLFSKKYRLDCEIEAYKEQLKYSPGREELYATFISTKYNIPISVSEAQKLLTQE